MYTDIHYYYTQRLYIILTMREALVGYIRVLVLSPLIRFMQVADILISTIYTIIPA